MNYVETWKEVIQRPSDFFRRMPTTGGYADPLTFAAISYIIYGLLTALINPGMSMGSMFGAKELSFSMILASVVAMPIMGIISLFIGGVILYFIYKLLGGTGTYEGTVRFIAYSTAILAISWIPIIGLIASIYGIYLYIVGGSFVHNVSMGKSTIAVLLPTILIFLLAMVIASLAILSNFAF